jgi:hypothetical protein
VAKYTWFGLQRTPATALIAPLPNALLRGATDDGDEPVLGPNELVSRLGNHIPDSDISKQLC